MPSVRKTMKIILIISAILILFLMLILRMASFIMEGRRQSPEEAMEWQAAHYDTSFYRDLEKTDYTVRGDGDYLLHVRCLKNPEQTGAYVILSHGLTDNRMGSLKYVPMYMELGYNCIIYDLRGHGENEKTFTTYGILESRDLVRLAEDTRSRYPDLTSLGLHGESLGAATTVMALKYHPAVDFAVADCGFSDLENVLRTGYTYGHIPSFVISMADLGARLRYHYSLRDMRPIDALEGNEIPVLFIHGADDPFILPKNSQDMYERTAGPREIRLIPGAGHAVSILTDPNLYRETVSAFLERLK